MQSWYPDRIRKVATRVYRPLGASGATKRRSHVLSFAKKHRFVYFETLTRGDESIPAIGGSTLTVNSTDRNVCMGMHAGYDIAFVERFSEFVSGIYPASSTYWYVLEIDLKKAHDLPFMVIGTTQQTKSYYASLFTAHPECEYIRLETHPEYDANFHAHHAIIASRSSLVYIHRLFDNDVVQALIGQRPPFAIEINGDSLFIVTEARKSNEQLIDKLLHFGIWFAKQVDEKIG